MKPRLLDLFCGAGGAGAGYARAGFDVTGVDIAPQKRYPFAFVQADALEYLARYGREYDVIHASPPCQRFSIATICRGQNRHPDLLGPTRSAFLECGQLWVLENVERAPMQRPAILLCGLMFGLKVFRHRWFESSELLFVPEHPRHGSRRIGRDGMVCVAGHSGSWFSYGKHRHQIAPDHRSKTAWERAMGIDWMSRDELSQAIPPAYTHWIGTQLIARFSPTE